MNNVEELLKMRKEKSEKLEKEAPNLYNGFSELMNHFYKKSALDIKYKELIAVALSVQMRCVPCIAYHCNQAVMNGASREEILDAASIGVEFGGGPSYAMVRNEMLDILDQIEG